MQYVSFLLKRVAPLTALLSTLGMPVHSMATPWIPVGDQRAKHSVQLLADRGCLAAPSTTWPMMWADVSPALDNEEAPEYCRNTSAWRYLTFERNMQRRSNARLGVKLGHATREPLFRDFNHAPRSTGEATINIDVHAGPMAIGLNPTYVHDPLDGDYWRYDNSYMAGKIGNWVLGAGAIDRWWGPGWHSSVILSNNARPVPGVWINRGEARPSGWRPLSWLGPWHFVAFAGELESNRHVSNAKLLGARFTVKPASFIELGASRTAQWAGEGQPSNLKSLGNAIIGRDNGQTKEDPSNQLAGFDLRIAAPIGKATLGFYAQLIGEDEAGGMPAKDMQQAGLDLATQYGLNEQRFYLEVADNQTGSWFSDSVPNVGYEHSVYKTGYRYKSRVMGSTWESDSRVYTLGAAQYFANGNDLTATYSYARLNYTDTVRARPTDVPGPLLAIPGEEQKVHLLTVAYGMNILQGKAGRLTLAGQFTDRKINVDNTDHSGQYGWPKAIGMATWEYRFD